MSVQESTQVSASIVNGVDANPLMATASQIQHDPAVGKFRFRADNHWNDGSQNTSQIKNFFVLGGEDSSRKDAFEVHTDQPNILGGRNTAPNPVEYVLHALGACLTTTLVYHAAVQGIEIEEIDSDYEGDLDARGFFGISDDVDKGYNAIRATMRVRSSADENTLRQLALFSPVYEMLSRALPVEFNLIKT